MKKAFTLIEMLFVLSVVMLIFLLTIPNIQKALALVKEKACLAQTKVVDAAILQYELSFDTSPSSVDDLIDEGFITEEQIQCSNDRIIDVVDGQAYVQ